MGSEPFAAFDVGDRAGEEGDDHHQEEKIHH
jgi:hypothetical protein